LDNAVKGQVEFLRLNGRIQRLKEDYDNCLNPEKFNKENNGNLTILTYWKTPEGQARFRNNSEALPNQIAYIQLLKETFGRK
jgi:hypothetical protein